MSDDFQPFATAGSGKSPEEVAFDLVSKLKGQGVWGERNRADILDMYAECLDATRGLRAYEGQKRIETPTTTPVTRAPAQPATQPLTQPATQARAQAQQTAAPQVQPQLQAHQQHVQPTAQSVQAQQAHLQQAFKQG
jgi:hypothetical protein